MTGYEADQWATDADDACRGGKWTEALMWQLILMVVLPTWPALDAEPCWQRDAHDALGVAAGAYGSQKLGQLMLMMLAAWGSNSPEVAAAHKTCAADAHDACHSRGPTG